MDNACIKKLEADLWESADLLRAGSKLTSNQYCMPVLGLLFLRYAYSRYKMVEEEILKDRPVRNGRKMPVEASDFTAKSALFLPEMAQFDYLVNLPENVASLGLVNVSGQTMGSLGEVVNNAMELVEDKGNKTPFSAEKRMGYQIYKKALENGLILRPLGNVLYFNPALIITEEQLDTAIDIAYNALINVLGE